MSIGFKGFEVVFWPFNFWVFWEWLDELRMPLLGSNFEGVRVPRTQWKRARLLQWSVTAKVEGPRRPSTLRCSLCASTSLQTHPTSRFGGPRRPGQKGGPVQEKESRMPRAFGTHVSDYHLPNVAEPPHVHGVPRSRSPRTRSRACFASALPGGGGDNSSPSFMVSSRPIHTHATLGATSEIQGIHSRERPDVSPNVTPRSRDA